MQTIQANNYPIYFNEQGYEALNLHINSNKLYRVYYSGH
jgi:3-dehydroquinate synthase